MKKHIDEYDEAWFAKLDALVTGKKPLSQEDDDLLHVAAKLSDALASLNRNDTISQQNRFASITHLQLRQNAATSIKSRIQFILYGIVIVISVLFVFFNTLGTNSIDIQLSTLTRTAGKQIWHTATSFEQTDVSSVALLVVKKAGVRPLLPYAVPLETQAIEFGIILDGTNSDDFSAFTASYRIKEKDVFIYEQAGNTVFSSSAAQNISIESSTGHIFQDNTGSSIIQWYQDGMTCQIASTLPLNELLAIARQFRPITRWELLL